MYNIQRLIATSDVANAEMLRISEVHNHPIDGLYELLSQK
jgi:hypothetical protein